MRSTAMRLSFVVICLAALLVAAAGYADRVYKVGSSKGMPDLAAASETEGRPIHEVRLCATSGRFRAFNAPPGWDVAHDPMYGDRGIIWSTDVAPVEFGKALAGFKLKKSGGGDVSWMTIDANGDVINWGWVKLKGR